MSSVGKVARSRRAPPWRRGSARAPRRPRRPTQYRPCRRAIRPSTRGSASDRGIPSRMSRWLGRRRAASGPNVARWRRRRGASRPRSGCARPGRPVLLDGNFASARLTQTGPERRSTRQMSEDMPPPRRVNFGCSSASAKPMRRSARVSSGKLASAPAAIGAGEFVICGNLSQDAPIASRVPAAIDRIRAMETPARRRLAVRPK